MGMFEPMVSLWQTALGKNKSGRVSDYFSPEMLAKIKDAVFEAEKNTSGEIRVKIMKECDDDLKSDANRYAENKVRQQALREFEKAGLHNTRDKTGVLVLVVLKERKFTIMADKGIYSKLPQSFWDHKAETMAGYFREGNYARGVSEVVLSVGQELSRHFPRKTDDVNELSDDVIVEDK
ncbi:MAG: hypothetical protein UV01_C0004G0015 [Parcubacteria group bacterium GW2011_GWA2_42_14]|nr:MAG: hypothetical protein UV01_C0004G0015 [Parcubacteria group bacterium GW2011_GWA2_42_14]